MSQSPFHKLTMFLKHLEEAHLYYTLGSHRDDAIMVLWPQCQESGGRLSFSGMGCRGRALYQ